MVRAAAVTKGGGRANLLVEAVAEDGFQAGRVVGAGHGGAFAEGEGGDVQDAGDAALLAGLCARGLP